MCKLGGKVRKVVDPFIFNNEFEVVKEISGCNSIIYYKKLLFLECIEMIKQLTKTDGTEGLIKKIQRNTCLVCR